MRGILALALACAPLACSDAPRKARASDASGAILIGEFQSLSGPLAERGSAFHAGLVRALEACNAAGGIGGRDVEVQAYDDRGVAAETAQAVERLIDEQRVVLLVGGSSRELAHAALAVSREVPLVAPFGDGLVELDPDRWLAGLAARDTPGPDDEATGFACGALACAAMARTRTFEPSDLWKALAAERRVSDGARERDAVREDQAVAFEAWTRARERARAAAAQSGAR